MGPSTAASIRPAHASTQARAVLAEAAAEAERSRSLLRDQVSRAQEELEQLRALQSGMKLVVGIASEPPPPGVDTLEDLERVRATFSRQ